MISSVSLPIITTLLSLLEYMVRFLLLSVNDINLGFIVSCIFHPPNFLRSFITSHKRDIFQGILSLMSFLLLYFAYLSEKEFLIFFWFIVRGCRYWNACWIECRCRCKYVFRLLSSHIFIANLFLQTHLLV